MRLFDRNLLIRLHLWYAGRGSTRSAKLLAQFHPGVLSLSQTANCWRLETTNGTYFISEPSQFIRIAGFGTDMATRVFEKYRYPDFVAVDSGDTVLDVGAFIGEFSMHAAEQAGQLVAVEPDKRNVSALKKNLAAYNHADVLNQAVWHQSETVTFNMASDSSEGSLLGVDATMTDVEQSIKASTVKEIANEFDWPEIDFLKIEAEGAEPEVLKGIEDLRVKKIAVECSPERNGESPIDDVLAYLSEKDYTIRKKDSVVFGKHKI